VNRSLGVSLGVSLGTFLAAIPVTASLEDKARKIDHSYPLTAIQEVSQCRAVERGEEAVEEFELVVDRSIRVKLEAFHTFHDRPCQRPFLSKKESPCARCELKFVAGSSE